MCIRIPRSVLALLLASLGLLAAAPPAVASPIKDDEEVLFFRTGAAVEAGADTWKLPIRGWVFERERNSFMRKILLKALARSLGLPPGSDEDERFRRRAELFLADSEGRKEVRVQVGEGTFELPRTGSDGLLEATLLSPPVGGAPGDPRFLRFRAVLPEDDPRRFEGSVLLAPGGDGRVVVSDIDDTLKVTHVNDRGEMLRNTFLRPFRGVQGMPERFAAWAGGDTVFHYVSSSPMQLYPSLVEFLDARGFPPGGVHLRSFFGRDARAQGAGALSGSSHEHKLGTITELLGLHPSRRFVLVGDSGEADPEIYGEVARAHPGRIERILIRRAPEADESPERYAAAFAGLPVDLWEVVDAPDGP